MKTKYVLHGGETGIPNENNSLFYQEWVKDFSEDFIPTILLTYFSRSQEEWGKLEQQDKERFAQYTNNRSVNFVIASSDLKVFEDQVKQADVVYLRGGSSDVLINTLSPIKDIFLSMIEDKVYAGASAGVMVLSHFTRSHTSEWKEGLGLLPINSIVHWSEELRNDFENFKSNHSNNNYEYLLIPETEFIVKYF